MSCSRCAGLMVPVGLIDWESTYLPCPAHKCVNCGHVTDALISSHQQHPQWLYRSEGSVQPSS